MMGANSFIAILTGAGVGGTSGGGLGLLVAASALDGLALASRLFETLLFCGALGVGVGLVLGGCVGLAVACTSGPAQAPR